MIKYIFKTMYMNKGRTTLIFILSLISFGLCMLALNNGFAFHSQQNMIKNMFTLPLDSIYRIDVSYIKNESDAGQIISNLKNKINTYADTTVGAYDETGVFFDELVNNEQFISLNLTAYEGTFREESPQIAEVIFIDPAITDFTSFSLKTSDFEPIQKNEQSFLPIYVGKDFKNIIKVGDVLTLSRTKQKYIVQGYINDKLWFDDSDALTMPPVSLDHKFFAPFSELDQVDSMTQQSTIGKIFFHSNSKTILNEINSQALASEMKIRITSIDEFLYKWYLDNRKIIQSNFFVAFIVIVCSATSIISTLCVSILLKKREYGIRIAFGSTKRDVMISIFLELFLIVSTAVCISYVYVRSTYVSSTHNNFNSIYLHTLNTYTLLSVITILILFLFIVLTIPLIILSRYQPATLIKEE